MNINEIGQAAHAINASNGWDTFRPEMWSHENQPPFSREDLRFICTHMALVHTEVSEATEAIRHHDRANFDEELADVVIRVASIAHGLGTDLAAAITSKLAKNMKRGLHHGGKAV